MLHHDPLLAVSPRGDYVVVIEQTPARTSAATVTIKKYDASGRLIRSTTHGLQVSALTKAGIDSVAESIVASSAAARSGGAAKAQLARLYVNAGSPWPAFRPAVDNIVIGDDDTIWLRSNERPKQWYVFGSEGQLLAEISFPDNMYLRAASRTDAWLLMMEASGVQRLVRMAFARTSGE